MQICGEQTAFGPQAKGRGAVATGTRKIGWGWGCENRLRSLERPCDPTNSVPVEPGPAQYELANLRLRRDLERARLEALDNLAQTRNALVVARERTPVPHRRHALPRPEAHERLRVPEIAKQERLGVEPLAAAPVDPFTPALHELRLPPGLHVPGRVRVRRFHDSSSRRA